MLHAAFAQLAMCNYQRLRWPRTTIGQRIVEFGCLLHAVSSFAEHSHRSAGESRGKTFELQWVFGAIGAGISNAGRYWLAFLAIRILSIRILSIRTPAYRPSSG